MTGDGPVEPAMNLQRQIISMVMAAVLRNPGLAGGLPGARASVSEGIEAIYYPADRFQYLSVNVS
jgi:hypothetical protein